MAGHYAALPSLEVLEGMVNNRAPVHATPSQARGSPTVSKWARPVAEGITIIDDILSLLRGTGLEAEILELVTTASDVHRVLQQVQGMLAAGQAMPEGYEFQVLHFATVRGIVFVVRVRVRGACAPCAPLTHRTPCTGGSPRAENQVAGVGRGGCVGD